ncbi:MAG: glycosyltransferase family 4 protein [Nocardioidaceae bacterium]
MRVLVLSNLYPPNALGGYEMSCRDVVDRWRAAGHDVTVLTTSGTVGGVVEPAAAEPHVRRSLRWYWRDHVFQTPPWREVVRLEGHNQAVLREVLASSRPDVVSAWHLGGMSLSLLTSVQRAGVPVVLNVCDDWPVYGPRVDPWSRWSADHPRLARAAARAAGLPAGQPDLDGCASSFVSAFTLAEVRARSGWAFPGAVVVGSGVDTGDFPLAIPREREWRGALLAVGRVEPRKGFDTPVAALAHLPAGTTLRVAGVAEPEHLQALQRLAADVGAADRVRFGPVPRGDLRGLYASADAVLFPSRWEEPFGLVPLEAMTQGTPVVATRRGGSAEFLADGRNCLEVPAGDAAALAAAVQRLAAEPALRQRLAEGGLATAARYTADALADRLERLHRDAADAAATVS